MKKNLIYSGMIAAMCFAAAEVKAQTDWHITGNAGTTSTNYLGTSDTKDLRIRTNNKNRITIKGSGADAGKVGINNTLPATRLDVLGTTTDTTVIKAIAKNSALTADYPTIYAQGTSTAGFGIGVQGDGGFTGILGTGAVGVLGLGGNFADTTSATGNESDGMDAIGGVSNFSIGVYAQGADGQFNTGIYAVCGPAGTPADSDNTHHNWAGQFIGDIVYSRAFRFSDAKLKENIQPLENVVAKLSQIMTTSYLFKRAEYPGLSLPSGNQIGFISENVEKVFPELVKDASTPEIKGNKYGKIARPAVSFKAVNYEGFIPLTVAAINEQQKQLDAKDAQIADLNARLSALEAKLSGNSSAKLSSVNNVDASLEQNNPNPFNQSTQIRYTVPANYSSAKIIITSVDGKAVRTYTLSGKGQGQVTLNASELAVGSYTYSLNVDGKIVDTKTLVLTK